MPNSAKTFSLLVAMVLAAATAASTAAEPAPGKKKFTNRLAKETSPYLLLHAHNPVDWYPWGEEALAKAKKENKLIFLSVGYSSCHWCHVMERESFLDEEIAALLNKHYVCIKVDREERPDVDTIYMTAVQLLTRRGGWPMSVFLTPDAQPFFGGTYFPARDGDRGASIGFFTLLQRVEEIWEKEPQKVQDDAKTLTAAVKSELDGRRPAAIAPLSAKLLPGVQAALDAEYDAKYGGFGFSPTNPLRPKFPEPSNLVFLLDQIENKRGTPEEIERARELVSGTLTRMEMGGIRDHLGGGFHRYSVDRFWRIPHFEKMLYDNGQLASVYAEAYAITGREDFRRVVEELVEFVLREMTDDGGAFVAALDAESEGEEGKFYRWEKDAAQSALSQVEWTLFSSVYGLDGEPNFDDLYYAPQLSKPLAEIAASQKTTEGKLEAQLAPIRAKLLAERNKRPRPLTDTKILTSCNGLMIRGLADAGRVLKNERYVKVAGKAADFVLAKLRTPDGRLLRTYGQGQARLNAYLPDYAFLVDGLLALHKASGEKKWLTAADELTSVQVKLFWDETHGGFFFTSGDHESLLARGKDPVDGAQPSGNSVSADNLVRLAVLLDKPEYLDKARRTIQSVSGLLETSPTAAPRMAVALGALLEAEKKK